MLGVVLSLLSSVGYTLNAIAIRRAMVRASAAGGVYVTVFAGLPLFAIGALVSGQLFRAGDFSAGRLALLAAAGVLHYGIGRYFNYRAIQAVGANRAGPVMELQVLVSLGAAVLLLGERLTPLMAAGIALILLGPLVTISAPASRAARANSARLRAGEAGRVVARAGVLSTGIERPAAPPAVGAGNPLTGLEGASSVTPAQLREGYAFAALNAALWGSTPILIRLGVGGTGLGIAGGFVAYLAASMALLPWALAERGRREMAASTRASPGWLVLATVSITQGVMFRYMALAVAPVTVVIPLMRAAGVFRLPLTFLVNRRIESFEARVVAGLVIAMVGGFLLTVPVGP